jgi:hypothetical protein
MEEVPQRFERKKFVAVKQVYLYLLSQSIVQAV